MLAERLHVDSFDGEGVKRAVESGDWFVGIKNYKPGNDKDLFTSMERHFATDEVFVLLAGKCTLVIDVSPKGMCEELSCVPMEAGKVYCIHKSVWHTTVTSKDAKLILVENRNTSMENSEVLELSAAQLAALRKQL